MAKPSVSSISSNSNVQFYSSTGYYSGRSGRLCQGPRKVICFCLLAVITPSLFVSLVLVMRFVLNGSATYHINPSDMRILDHKISTTWCQRETIRMNTSFTAFLPEGVPKLIKAPAPLTTTKTLIIPDDHKEYWGFYLLKGSSFRIRTCARHKGATVLIVKGRNHLHHCAYIGDSDSAGDSDEFSNSNSVEDDHLKLNQTRPTKPQPTTSQEEMSVIMSKIRSFVKHRAKGHQRLKENLASWMLIDNDPKNITTSSPSGSGVPKQLPTNNLKPPSSNSVERLVYSTTENSATNPTSASSKHGNTSIILNSISVTPSTEHHKIRHANSTHRHHGTGENIHTVETAVPSAVTPVPDTETVPLRAHEHGKIHRLKRNVVDVRKLSDSGENGAFEDESVDDTPLAELQGFKANVSGNLTWRDDTPTSIWETEHSHHKGILNDTNPYAVIDGSDSESESSFSSSEEALAKCEGVIASLYLKQSTESECGDDADLIPIVFEDIVNTSGYYYFIFGSENEKRDNFIRARFELEKYVYDLPQPVPDCVGVRECRVNLTFWSSQKLVVQIPQPAPETEFVWDEIYIAESECEPRVLLYLLFVFIVPVSIILCAFQ